MPICRIMKENNYTRGSKHYLRDNSLSFKAKGLLTLMLSLPEDWDYTIAGLAQFPADGRVSIASTIRELEERGYIRRNQTRGENGAFASALLLGDRSGITYQMNTAFKVSGISHIIAVSGLHVSILFGLIYFLTG